MTFSSKHAERTRYSTLDIMIVETFERNWFSQHLKQGTEEHEKHQQYCLPKNELIMLTFGHSGASCRINLLLNSLELFCRNSFIMLHRSLVQNKRSNQSKVRKYTFVHPSEFTLTIIACPDLFRYSQDIIPESHKSINAKTKDQKQI
ncbi:hypothetical protein BLNAU_2546 [Blattamonas nauphoetae]|uniref:Uncharacterized protein n=1 Tax=Blattamonas nauphoetae TaxID=2049346 RepID=A0ABQ9YF36_9EUKA|nr:hypothetical protein BLNAU_2546 [Blattamonas nauphoetae]